MLGTARETEIISFVKDQTDPSFGQIAGETNRLRSGSRQELRKNKEIVGDPVFAENSLAET